MPFVEPVTKKGAEMTERNNQRVIFHVTKEKRRKIWEGKTSGPTFIFCSQDPMTTFISSEKLFVTIIG
jgi:hypothetical protein